MDTVLAMCCELYNALLESWRGQYLWHRHRHAFDGLKLADVYDEGRICGDRGTLYAQFSEMRRSEQRSDGGEESLLWSDLSLNIGRGVIDRFDKARAAFFDRCKQRRAGARVKAGYPRFKPRARWRSIAIPDASESMVKRPDDGSGRWRISIKGLGTIKFAPHNEKRLVDELAAGGKVAEIRVVRKALRTEVHLIVRTAVPDSPAPAQPVNGMGIDLGITNRVALSNGDLHPGVDEDRSEVTARQLELSRHDNRCRKLGIKRFTTGRRRRVASLAKAHARLSERERHSVHRLVHEIIRFCVANDIDGLAAELLRINNMVRNPRLADRIQQQRWGMFLRLLEIKAARAGIAYAQADPRNTSLDCSRCRHRKPKRDLPLSVRVYVCDNCGLVVDRDVNAAINVLVRAFGDEALKGGATPRCGQYAPLHGGGATHSAPPRTPTANRAARTITTVSADGSSPRPTRQTVSLVST